MRVLIFDLKAPLGHFRRPDTTTTHATYPFITRTALRGLVGSILGYEEFLKTAWTGIQLMAPVRLCSQELSMLGKGFLASDDSFNRPTSIELVVKPFYRVYYHGEDQAELAQRVRNKHSHYHTYLGSAYALCVPRFVGEINVEEILPQDGEQYTAVTVVPSHLVGDLKIVAGLDYGRVGGVHYTYLGQRRFRDTVNLIYEVSGKSISFTYRPHPHPTPVRFAKHPEDGIICLW